MAKRKIISVLTFEKDGDFGALHKAKVWLRENGYSYGSTCVGADPVPICIGEYDLPQKWYNLSQQEKDQAAGRLYFQIGTDAKIQLFAFSPKLQELNN